MSLKVGISTVYEALVIDNQVYPKKVAGDILQAYWIIGYLRKNNFDIEFRKISPKNDLNHFFYFPYFSVEGDFGFNANFWNFFKYSVFTSYSAFSKLFSINELFRKIYYIYKKKKFIWKNKNFLKNIKHFKPKYVVCNSQTEKNELDSFLKELDLEVENFYIIYNPLDYEEIDFLLSLDFSIFDKVKKDYGLPQNYGIFVGRFDRIKNIDRFIMRYVKKEINKEIPLVILGNIMDYDKAFYNELKKLANNKDIFVIIEEEVAKKYFENKIFENKIFVDLGEKDGNNIEKERFLFSRKIVLEFMKNSSFVVLPSFVESFGFTGLEALYLNKPFIVTKNSPYYELFPEFINKSVKIIDPIKLDFNLSTFIFSNNILAKDYIKEKFGVDKIAIKYLEVWRKYA